MADDYTHDLTTTGAVSVGGAATGEIEQGNDFDWFTVELVAGRTYVIDVEGLDTGNGTLDNPVLRGLYDNGGVRIAGTQRTGGGENKRPCTGKFLNRLLSAKPVYLMVLLSGSGSMASLKDLGLF